MFLLKYYQYQISQDGISYISIAQKYLNGDFRNAINGYCGPLLSWLLIPFLYFDLSPLIAIKVISLITGLFTMIGVKLLSYKFEMTERIRNIILFSLIPIILFFSLLFVTPDLLLLCLLVYYLNIIFSSEYPNRIYKGIFCGIIGALAYLAKAYAFYFFIVHFLLFNTLHYIRSATGERKGNVLRSFFWGFIIFFIISAAWVLILSNKYQGITITTAKKYIYACMNPESPSYPMFYQGFLKPPNETAVSAWEDPSYLKIKFWNPMQSWNHFKHQIKLILQNIYTIIIIYESFSFLSIMIIIVYILFCIQPFNKVILQGDAFYPLVTIMLYPTGFVLMGTDARYLWITDILLILMGGHILSVLFRNVFFNNVRKKIVLMFLILSFIAIPIKCLIKGINTGKDIYNLSKILERHNMRGSNIASNNNWPQSLYLSYYLNSKYYGIPRKNISDENLESELKKNNIDYYLIWDESSCNSIFLHNNYKEVTKKEIPGLKIYSLKERENNNQ
ncbi:MAG: hypothetical protein Q8R31_05020 [Candidatus Omnitrophota bacterium]|nr:hypothetical protein [Candidatus Omnitrophota bacterium]